ncbi:MAG TPA: homocysteine S-methyltransferase family protein, partial [Chloroflexota bacterium]|nr:homocysteine S-methyltransferase family protein [Chloroflexota bacterium]
TLREWKLAAVGANCGNNLPDTMAAIAAMRALDPEMPLIAKANAGIPRWGSNGALEYDGTPAVMAGYAYHVHQTGAQLIGACCGSSPETIRAMTAALCGEIPAEELMRPEGVGGGTAIDGRQRGRRRRR